MARRRGFSLAETVVALGLLAGALIGACGLILVTTRQVEGAGNVSRALTACSSILEQIEACEPFLFRQSLGCGEIGPTCRLVVERSGTSSWREALAGAPRGASAEIGLLALQGDPQVATRLVRITVVVRWSEGVRRRGVGLVAVRSLSRAVATGE